MERKHILIAVNFILAALLAASIFKSSKSISTKDIELTQTPSKIDSTYTAQTSPHKTLATPQRAPSSAKQEQQITKNAFACFSACQTRIIEHLTSGVELTSTDANLITHNLDIFLPRLTANPNALAALLQNLKDDDGKQDKSLHIAAYAVETGLADADRLAASQALLAHKDPAFRIAGIKLAASAATNNPQAIQSLNVFAGQETNARVLSAIINYLPRRYDDTATYNPETIELLNRLTAPQNSDYIRGSAIVAKSQLVQSPSEVRLDVRQALQSSSNKMRSYGLQAYSIIKDRQSNTQENRAKWDSDDEMQDLLNTLIDDPTTNKDSRALALKLIRS